MVLGGAAEGATRSNTEDRGAGPEGGDGTDMGNVPNNDTHHNNHGAPSEGHDEGKQEGQVVDDSNSNKEAEAEPDNAKNRGKKKAKGNVDGYKRPVFARYHEEGSDPHHKTPNRNGNPKGNKESNNKAETSKDSGEGIETEQLAKNPEAKKDATTDPDQEEKEAKAKHQAKTQANDQDPNGQIAKKPKAKKSATTNPNQEEKEAKAKHQAKTQADDQDPSGQLAKNPKAKKGGTTNPDQEEEKAKAQADDQDPTGQLANNPKAKEGGTTNPDQEEEKAKAKHQARTRRINRYKDQFLLQAEKETEDKRQANANDQNPTEEDTGEGHSGMAKNPKAKKGARADPDQAEEKNGARHRADDQTPH